jgi:high-affinity iron transporter
VSVARALIVAAVVIAAGGPAVSPAQAAEATPWLAGERIDRALLDAQTALLLDEGEGARERVDAARDAFATLSPALERLAPAAAAEARSALARAATAASTQDDIHLAAARGEIRAALYLGSYRGAVGAAAEGRAAAARRWLLLRDFRTATRFTRPDADATDAVEELASGELSPAEAATAVKKDLLDTYQSRLRELIDDARAADARDFAASRAERAALARGYWSILSGRYRQVFDASKAAEADRRFDRLAAAGISGASFPAAARSAARVLDGFTAAPFTVEEQARYATQLLRFVDLIPFEYGKGVDDGRVTIPFEIQEAKSFRDGAESAFRDLEAQLRDRDPAATRLVEDTLAQLEGQIADAATGGEVAPEEDIEAEANRVIDALEATYPEQWKGSSIEADFDLVRLTLDQMDAAIAAGEYEQAEQARLAAYAFFEFGPELRLRSLDPGLALDTEGLFWFGARDEDGLAELIASRAPSSETRPVRLALDDLLDDAQAVLGDGASKATVLTNAALVVFREGLEAVLILAAVTAGLTGTRRRLRRPVAAGAGLALAATAVTYVLARTVLGEFSQYGEKLEAVVGLVAIGVLLVVLNWFLHKVYWTGWISSFHKRRQRLLTVAGGGLISAQVIGFCLLGFSMTYREGFETVLFLQALELNAGLVTVLEGTAIGLVAVAAVGVATFALERRLPYKRMLIVTGVLIGMVLVMLVGNTVRTMQGVGWVPIIPLDVDLPYWLGMWFGVYPTVETVVAQLAAAAFVIGSYFAAEWWRKRRIRAPKPEMEPAPARAAISSPAPTDGSAPRSRPRAPAGSAQR